MWRSRRGTVIRYRAFAADYDGTLVLGGAVSAEVESALRRLRSTGRRVIVVTGRTFEELVAACPNLELFDYAVLENGGVLYNPSKRETTMLGPPVSRELARVLERRGVGPIITGRVILSTRRPHEGAVQEVISDLGLDDQIIFNDNAVMVLPSGMDKGSGLEAALREMGLSGHEVVGVGNGENDQSFLEICGCSVAVANAVAEIRATVDFCTAGSNGTGVTELINELITTDLSRHAPSET